MIIRLKGADFSASNIGSLIEPTTTTWYQNATRGETSHLTNTSDNVNRYQYHNNSEYVGKTINALRFLAPETGTINYGLTDGTSVTSTYSLEVTTTGELITYSIPNLTIPTGSYFWINGHFNYSQSDSGHENLWFTTVGGANVNKFNLGIDLGYVVAGEDTPTTTTWYLEAVDGYDVSRAADNSKYYYTNNEKYAGKTINALKIISSETGTINYGTYDGSTYSDALVATVSTTGTQIINIPPLTFGENEHFWVQASGIGVFCYGPTSDEPDLYFTMSNGNLNQLNLGISLGYVVE